MDEFQIQYALNCIINNETPSDVILGPVLCANELEAVDLESKRFLFVANTKKRRKNVGHWVVIEIIDSNTVEYFDSFGHSPEGLVSDFLSKFNVSYNYQTLQHSESLSCGAYCVYYVYNRYKNKSQIEIIDEFVSKYANRHGTSPSKARDFDLFQSVFNYFKIPIKPVSDPLFYSWHLYFYLYIPIEKHVIKTALKFIRQTWKDCAHVTIGHVITADELNEINLESERVIYLVNNSKRGESLGRWVLMEIKNRNEVEFFDSLGKPPEGLIADFYYRFENRSYNEHVLQQHRTMACGVYCLNYALWRYLNKSREEFIHYLLSEYKNKYGIFPSIPRDFHLLYDVCKSIEKELPFQNCSPLYWHINLPMAENQIKHALEFIIKFRSPANVTIGGAIASDELNEINLDSERIIYLVNNCKKGEIPGRWVLIEIKNHNEVEFFDSLGKLPEGLIADFYHRFKTKSYNFRTLQYHDAMACGAYCIYYAYLRYIENKSQIEIVHSIISDFEYALGTLPSKIRDYEFYCEMFNRFSIPTLF